MQITIWDLGIRIFHWSTASLFLANYWLTEEGEDLHEWFGYALAALLVFRVVWGFIGNKHARFASFWPTPSRVKHYLINFKQYHSDNPPEDLALAGHNPLGSLMVIFMLACLVCVSISGWMQTLDAFWGEDWVQNLHEISANLMMFAVIIHVIAVLVVQKLTRVALVKTMITGKRTIIKK